MSIPPKRREKMQRKNGEFRERLVVWRTATMAAGRRKTLP
jgi:hypothetical protein